MPGNGSVTHFRWKEALHVAIIYTVLVLAFTGLGMIFAPPAAQVGGTRALAMIPAHLLALAGFGLLLGLGCMLIYGKEGLPFVLLTPALTVELDVDHLPVYLGYAEAIRPAHSLLFLIAVLAATAITVKALDIELVVMSAFMGHMAVDTGLFAPFSPLSFGYVQLDQYRPVFALVAVLCALAAGVVMKRRQGGSSASSRGLNA
jgi:hypothetical protein